MNSNTRTKNNTATGIQHYIYEIRLKNKHSKKIIKEWLYDVAQFKNLLILLQQEHKQSFGSFMLDQALIYTMLATKPQPKKYEEKKERIKKIMQQPTLRKWIKELKKQKEKVNNNYVVQYVIRQTIKDYKSFFKAIKRYKRNPQSFYAHPRPPRPRKLRAILYAAVACNRMTFKRLERNTLLVKIRIGKDSAHKKVVKVRLPPQLAKVDISSVRIKMVGTDIYIHVVYPYENTLHNTDSSSTKSNVQDLTYHAGIDLGLDTLLAIVSDNPTMYSILISGKELKSFNQWFNKKRAKIQALIAKAPSTKEKVLYTLQLKQLIAYRYRRIANDLHKLTHKLALLLYTTGHKTVFIGNNVLKSKHGVNLGSKTNQHFVSLPYRKLLMLLTYKLSKYGIEVIEVDESYTSKTSAWSGDVVRIQQVKKINSSTPVSYHGFRLHRGLFKDTTLHKVFHADLNGAFNILKIGLGQSQLSLPLALFLRKVCNPVRLSLERLFYLLEVSRESITVCFSSHTRWIAGSSATKLLLVARVDGNLHNTTPLISSSDIT